MRVSISVKWIASHLSPFNDSLKTSPPPITNTFPIERLYGGPANNSSAESLLLHVTTFSVLPMSKPPLERVKTTLMRQESSLYFAGMESHVFLPITTAFFLVESEVVKVKSLKNLRSVGRVQSFLEALALVKTKGGCMRSDKGPWNNPEVLKVAINREA
ncbi:Uncharacterized protein Rs2_12907 [Raphanus sativus]|nr:Uncharacterized protein Rs2_12907 [Raphanus sativus]